MRKESTQLSITDWHRLFYAPGFPEKFACRGIIKTAFAPPTSSSTKVPKSLLRKSLVIRWRITLLSPLAQPFKPRQCHIVIGLKTLPVGGKHSNRSSFASNAFRKFQPQLKAEFQKLPKARR